MLLNPAGVILGLDFIKWTQLSKKNNSYTVTMVSITFIHRRSDGQDKSVVAALVVSSETSGRSKTTLQFNILMCFSHIRLKSIVTHEIFDIRYHCRLFTCNMNTMLTSVKNLQAVCSVQLKSIVIKPHSDMGLHWSAEHNWMTLELLTECKIISNDPFPFVAETCWTWTPSPSPIQVWLRPFSHSLFI